MKVLVYTCVFGNYDWIFPPINPQNDFHYLLVTDNPKLHVKGWRTHYVNASEFDSFQSANRYYKTLIHKVFLGYDYSIYVDGNIRLLGDLSGFLAPFYESNADLGLFKHPLRSSVHDEVLACLKSSKIKDKIKLKSELFFYREDGFPDNVGLIEATILIKNHRGSGLDQAMELWWSLFEKYGTRDQLSLPYVIWKTNVSCFYQLGSFRDSNPYFGIYTHRGDSRAPLFYGYVEGRAYDSIFFRIILKTWRFSWAIRRFFRRS